MSLSLTKRNKSYYILLVTGIIFASFLNIFCSICASETAFPLYMDSFATIAIAAIAGCIPSILVAILTNGVLFLLGRLKFIFILCQLMTAIGSCFIFSNAKKHGEELFSLDSFMFSGILSAITNGIFGSLFAAFYHYNLTSIEQGLFLATKNIYFANLFGGFILNLVDKTFAAFIAFILYLFTIQFNKKTIKTITPVIYKIKPEYIFLIVAIFSFSFSQCFKIKTTKIFDSFYKQKTEAIQFNEQRIEEKNINKGFDSLSYTSFILAAISIFVMEVRLNKHKNQFEILQAQQKSQKSFSRELHDGVIQSLTALKLCLTQGNSEKALTFANDALLETRELLGLSRINFTDDFINLIQQYAKVIEENYKIKVNVYEASDYIKNINADFKHEMLKILQELLTNAGKHSKATEINVKLLDTSNNFIFSVSDNGCGFNSNTENIISHAGLKIINERASYLGGEIKIKSDEHGTNAILILPITKEN